jgi:hypothetical protein
MDGRILTANIKALKSYLLGHINVYKLNSCGYIT